MTAGRGSDNETKENGRGNELWLQTAPGVFKNHAPAWGVEDICGRSHYAATAEFNRDGWMDIYVGNADPRIVDGNPCDALPGSETSHLYINVGGTHFVDSTAECGLTRNGGVHCVEGVQFAGTKAPDLVTATSTAIQVWSGVRGPATTVLSSSSIHGLGVNPHGDIYVVRLNPYTDLTNPAHVVLVRETEGWSQAWAPDAAGVGDFVLWLKGAQTWLVGNGISDRLGPLQLIRTTP